MKILKPYLEIQKEIEDLKFLEFNWNSYNAPTIDLQCMGKAKQYLLLLARRGAPPPEGVVPTVYGGVELYWQSEDFMVDFNPSGSDGERHYSRVEVSFEIKDKKDMELATQLLSVLSNMQLDDIVEGVH